MDRVCDVAPTRPKCLDGRGPGRVEAPRTRLRLLTRLYATVCARGQTRSQFLTPGSERFEEGDEVVAVTRVERLGLAGGVDPQQVGEGGGAAVVEVGGGPGDASQRRRVEAM